MPHVVFAVRRRYQRFRAHQALVWLSALTLALWRWRTQRLLLLIAGLGITVAVVLVSSLPLFSSVMTTAGLRETLRDQPDNAQIIAKASVDTLSSPTLTTSSSQVKQVFSQQLGRYLLPAPPQMTVVTGN